MVLLASSTLARAGRIGYIRAGETLTRRDRTLFLQRGERARVLASDHQSRDIRWYQVAPEPTRYNNRAWCRSRNRRPCLQPIAYRHDELESLRGKRSFEVAEVPALRVPGTHWLTWVPGKDHPGALLTATAPTAFAVVVRRDCSYVGYLTELLGVPYVFAPGRAAAGGHQTDLRLGADCVALAVYGRRRLKPDSLPFLSLAGLFRHTRVLRRAPSLAALVKRRPPFRVGDLLHLHRHVAVLSKDRPPRGLGSEDTVIHSLDGAAEEIPVRRLPGGRRAVHLLRWKGAP